MAKQNDKTKPYHVKLYEQLQTRKLISAYGGVGSIIESTKGSLLVRPFDKWKVFEEKKWENIPEIQDAILVAKLKRIFPNLEKLVSPPANSVNRYSSGNTPQYENDVAAAEYFPKWMYCTKCSSFDKFENWKNKWVKAVQNDKGDTIEKNNRFFHKKSDKPTCYHCYKN